MTLTKEQISAIVSAIVSAFVAVLAVFGYNVIVVQPQIQALTAAVTLAAAGAGAACP